MTAQIVARGRRSAVPDGADPADIPIVVTLTVGGHTKVEFSTTPAALDGPDGDVIEHLVDDFGEHILKVYGALSAQVDANG